MHPENDDGGVEAGPLASALAALPEVWQRPLVEHVPDSCGRCLACRNSGTAGVPWPCTLQVAAQDARDLVEKESSAHTRCGAGT